MLVADPSDTRPSESATTLPPLFRHTKRDKWGLAVLLWENEGKREYRFEDGTERRFKEGYYHMFERAPAVGEAAERLLASLKTVPKVDPSATRRAEKAAEPTFNELVSVFQEVYTGGFADAQWKARVRGVGASRRAKKHREAAIAVAQEQLSRNALDTLVAAGNHAEIQRRATEVLGATDLVTRKQLAPLRTARPCSSLSNAIRAFLHEEDESGAHFDRLAQVLGRSTEGKPSWPLLTGLRALVHPTTHFYVRPSAFRAMAQVLAPTLTRKVRPHGGYYNRCVAMAIELRDLLAGHDEKARDLLDVHDFIWTVCRPSAGRILARIRQQAMEAATQQAAVAEESKDDEKEVVANDNSSDKTEDAETQAA